MSLQVLTGTSSLTHFNPAPFSYSPVALATSSQMELLPKTWPKYSCSFYVGADAMKHSQKMEGNMWE
jgi:hypothetical protein